MGRVTLLFVCHQGEPMKSVLIAVLMSVSFAASSATLGEVVDSKNIGKPLSVLGLGKGKEKNYLERSFVVEGCAIDVAVEKGAIASFSFDAVPKCQKAAQLLGVTLNGLTFGGASAVLGRAHYSADCLASCGNAADPWVHAKWTSNGRTVSVSQVLVEGPILDATLRWEKGITDKYGEDYVVDQKFNCTREFDAAGASVFKDIKVSRLTIGTSPFLPQCSSN